MAEKGWIHSFRVLLAQLFLFCGAATVSLTMLFVCSGDWVCSLCRNALQPEVEYDCENERTPGGHTTATYGLSACDQRVGALICCSYCRQNKKAGKTLVSIQRFQ